MTRPLRFGAATFCACMLALAACSADPSHAGQSALYTSLRASFKKADTNGDEQLTREEMAAGMPQFAPYFDELDTDHSGKVNFAELWSYVQFRYVQADPGQRARR
jgi:Ca2+-binding EF-hand superfamily protein